MLRLFHAYFGRLFKWPVFLALMGLMLIGGVGAAFALKDEPTIHTVPYVIAILIFPHYVGIIIGLFNYPLFTNGTIRNQLSVGHSRSNIFIMQWAASCTLSVVLYLIVSLSVIGVTALTDASGDMSAKAVVQGVAFAALLVVQFTTISQLFCVVFKGVKSFLAIYLGNQVIACAGIMLMSFSELPEAVCYLLPTTLCMQINSLGVDTAGNFFGEGSSVSFSFPIAFAVLIAENAALFTAGLVYFRKTDLN